MSFEKSPAFQFYPKDFLSDSNVVAMTLAERGVYITLLCLCWADGWIPNDEKLLARMCGITLSRFQFLWPSVLICFRAHPSDEYRLVHGRLEAERAKQAIYREKQSEKGKAGAAARWPRLCPGHNSAMAQAIPEHSSPVSDLPSPISNLQSVDQEQDPERSKPSSESKPDSDFEAFRSAYPKNRRQGGKRTKAAFREARKTASLEVMLTALEQHKRSEQWQDPKLIPLMTTWLHQERWTQELPSAQKHQHAVDYCGRPTFTSQNPAPWKCQLHDPPCATTDQHCALMAQEHGGQWQLNITTQLCEKVSST